MVYKFSVHGLLVLYEIENAGSLAAAAQKLGYSEATLAHHLRKTQAEAGVQVAKRVGRTLQLTAAGRALAQRAEAIAKELAGAENDLVSLGDLTTGTLRIVSFPSFYARYLPRALASFVERYPGVSVKVTESEPDVAIEMLNENKVDLAIVFKDPSEELETSRLLEHKLLHDPLKVVLPSTHPLAGNKVTSMEALADETWVAGCPKCQVHLNRLAGEADFRPNVSFVTDDYLAVQHFVANGLGVAILPQMAIENSPKVDACSLVDLKVPEHRDVLCLTHRLPPKAPQIFMEILNEQLANKA